MALNLDPRQRAMLQEMRAHVWWPVTQEAPAGRELSAQDAARAQAGADDAIGAVTATGLDAGVVLPSLALGAGSSSAARPAPAENPMTLALQPRADGVEHMDWQALQQAVAHCRACALCQGRHHTVFGMGGLTPLAAGQVPVVDWLIVGEAPGEQEDLSGLPFVGPAGQLLDNMLKAIGLDRRRGVALGEGLSAQGCFIANVLKCRPPANRNPESAEVAQCVPYLQRQIELLQPRIILAMGRFAAQTLLHDTVPDVHGLPLGKLRGKVHHYRGIPVVVTYHPAYLLRALGDKAKAWADLCLAVQVRRDVCVKSSHDLS